MNANASGPKHSGVPVAVWVSGVLMPMSRTRSSVPAITTSTVSPSITHSTTPTSGGSSLIVVTGPEHDDRR